MDKSSLLDPTEEASVSSIVSQRSIGQSAQDIGENGTAVTEVGDPNGSGSSILSRYG